MFRVRSFHRRRVFRSAVLQGRRLAFLGILQLRSMLGLSFYQLRGVVPIQARRDLAFEGRKGRGLVLVEFAPQLVQFALQLVLRRASFLGECALELLLVLLCSGS